MNQKTSSPYRWVILALMFFPCLMMSICQFQVTPYAAELMSALSLSEQQYAAVATAPMLVGVFLSFIAGALGDRFGVKKVVFISLILTTIGAFMRVYATNYVTLVFMVVIMGVVGVVLSSNNAKFMSSWFPPEELGLAIGMVVASGNAGTVVAMLLGTSLGSYKSAFTIGGVAFAILTVLWLLFAKERKTEPMPEGIPAGAPPKNNMGEVLKNVNVWLAALAAAFFMAVNMGVSALLSPGLVAKGIEAGAASFTVIVFSIVALVGSILMPGVIRKTPNTKITCFVISLITSATLYGAWLSEQAIVRNILIAICGLTAGSIIPTIMSIPTVLPEIGMEKMGAAGGMITTVMMAGAFLLPSYVVVPLAGGINNTAFLLTSGAGVVLGVLFLLLPNLSIAKK